MWRRLTCIGPGATVGAPSQQRPVPADHLRAELINASVLEGVLLATPQTQDSRLTGVQFDLAEDSAINIELPASLFGDIDLSIDPAEQLTYSLNTAEDLPFSFDAGQLKLTGRHRWAWP